MKTATPIVPKRLRCAIYTRKSTEHNLDLAFNSLDAQREACEAYIKSQAHEGWNLLPARYDDGGLSGASLQRPALQQLLADVRAGLVDVIVVYKVDRLTRSLADFAKLVEAFDTHAVAFVSVTQSFNTTSSMGRLTLNVLLSFAQFEREVIGERVRDKIAASKRKGLWLGGPVPLGYRSVDKALTVVPEDAAIVRTIFERYLAVGSIGSLIEDLYQRGIRPRRVESPRVDDDGEPSPPRLTRFTLGALAYILKNRIYVGEIAHKGEVHLGQHQPILARALFDAVQARLAEASVQRRTNQRASGYLLAGLLYDDYGNHMSPSHTRKAGARYRYYVSQAVLQNRRSEAGAIRRISAPDIEAIVIDGVRRHIADQTHAINSDGLPSGDGCPTDADLVAERVYRIILHADRIEIVLRSAQTEVQTAMPDQVVIPIVHKTSFARKGITVEQTSEHHLSPQARAALLTAISKARFWVRDLADARVSSVEAIACQEGRTVRHVRMLAPLAFLSPRIVAAIIGGNAPAGLTVTGLTQVMAHDWAEQERRLGIA